MRQAVPAKNVLHLHPFTPYKKTLHKNESLEPPRTTRATPRTTRTDPRTTRITSRTIRTTRINSSCWGALYMYGSDGPGADSGGPRGGSGAPGGGSRGPGRFETLSSCEAFSCKGCKQGQMKSYRHQTSGYGRYHLGADFGKDWGWIWRALGGVKLECCFFMGHSNIRKIYLALHNAILSPKGRREAVILYTLLDE